MNLTKHNTLSIAEGLRIQGFYLAEWKPRLSALAYEALAAEVEPDQVLDQIVAAIPQPKVEIGGGRASA
jgi:hypothetical protein